MPESALPAEQEHAKAKRSPWLLALRLMATVAVVWLLFRFVDFRAFLGALAGADLGPFLLILLLRPLIYLVRGWRFWHLLQADLAREGQTAPAARSIGWHFVSLNLGTFTPAGLGEVSLVYFMRRLGIGAGSTLTAMVLDKIITLGMVTVMGLVGAWLYLGQSLLWLVAFIGACLVALALSHPLRGLLAARRERAGNKAAQVIDALDKILTFAWTHPWALAVNVAVAVVQSLLFTAQIWLGFRMLHQVVDFLGIFWLTGLGRLLNMLPVTFGGLGVYEGSMVLLLEQLGAERAAALAAVLVPRTITWLVAGLVIALFVWWRPAREAL